MRCLATARFKYTSIANTKEGWTFFDYFEIFSFSYILEQMQDIPVFFLFKCLTYVGSFISYIFAVYYWTRITTTSKECSYDERFF